MKSISSQNWVSYLPNGHDVFCNYENLFFRLQVFLIWIMYQMKAVSFLYQMAYNLG
jgi:hypothetical protein